MATPNEKSSKTAVEMKSNRGIQGSCSVNTVPDGYALEMLNVDIGSSGLIRKRAGYLQSHTMPTKVVGIGNTSYRFNSTPITSFGMKVWTYEDSVRFNVNDAFDLRYYMAKLSSDTNVICQATGAPAAITLDTLIELADGSFVSPVFILDSDQSLFVLPMSAITTAKVGFTYAALVIAQNLVVGASYLPIYHTGYSHKRIREENISSGYVFDTSTIILYLPTDHDFAEVGTEVLFENSVYGASLVQLTGRVTKVEGLIITITLDTVTSSLAGTALDKAFFSMRYFQKSSTYVLRQPYAASESGTGRHKIPSIVSIQNSGYTSNTFAGQVFMYGTDINAGIVHSLDNLYHSRENKTRVVSLVGGHIFKEEDVPDYGLMTQKGLKITLVQAYQKISADSLGRYTIPITNASTVYKVGDIAIIQTVLDTTGAYSTDEYTVLTVNTNNVILQAVATSILVYNHTIVNFRRTSSVIPYYQVSAPTLVLPGSLITINEISYTVLNIDKASKLIYLNESIEFESEVKITAETYMKPVYINSTFDSSNAKLDEAPITSAYFEGEIEPHTAQFDNALFFACGDNGIVRYDGDNAYFFNLPQPPSGHIRSIPESIGFLPVTKGDNNVVVAKQVQVFVTYSFEDSLGRKVESGVTPDTDMMIIPEALQDDSGYSEVVELQIPSVPRESGLPADRIKINVYRFMTTEDEGESFAPVLDVSVANDPDKPFTVCRIGTQFISEFSSRDKLYTYDQTTTGGVYRESVRKAPYAKLTKVFGNRVVAANGKEPPYFELACNSVYDYTNSNRFGAYCKLTFNPFGVSTTDVNAYEFYNVPLALINNVLTIDTGKIPAWYPLSNIHAAKISIPANASTGITSVVYEEASHKFYLGTDPAVDYTSGTGVGNLFKLRMISKNTIAPFLPIDFNKGLFTQYAAYAAAADKLYLAAESKWTLPNISSGTPTELSAVKFLAFREGFVGISKTGSSGDAFITASEGVIRLYVKVAHSSYSVNQFQQKYMVFQGLNTMGNLHFTNNTKQLFWESDLTFYSPDAAADDTNFTGYKYYRLTPVTLSESLTSAGKPKFDDASIVASVGGIVASDTSYPLKIFVMLQGSSDLMGTPAGFTAPATTAKVTVTDSTNFAVGQFVTFDLPQSLTIPDGWPALKRGHQITVKVGNDLTVQVIPSDKLLNRTVPETLSPTGAFLYNQTAALSVGSDLTISLASVPTGMNINDWIYVAYRDIDEVSISLQLSGWFRVTAVDLVNSKVTVAAGNTALIDLTSVPSPRMGMVMWIDRASATQIRIPIPVPYQLDTIDVAGPQFDQNKAVRITPLSAIMKRMVMALNAVLGKYGCFYWGGSVGSISYPTNGFRFVAHKYPTDRYRHYKKVGNSYVYQRTTSSSLSENYDKLTIQAASGYYVLNATVSANSIWSPQTIDVTTNTFTYRNDEYNSRIWFTTEVSKNVIRAARIGAFQYGNQLDVNSGDGEEITGLATFQDSLLIFKTSSVFRLRFTETGTDLQRIQSPVGSIAGKNILTYEEGVFFVHNSGVYLTNGTETESVLELMRYFDERVAPSHDYIKYSSGYVDSRKKEVHIGIPYMADGSIEQIPHHQFLYNYNDSVKGYSVNDNMPAIWWTGIANTFYFCTDDGKIYKVRPDNDLKKYRDVDTAIQMEVATRFVDESTSKAVKFWRNVIVQLGHKNSFEMGIAWNYATDYASIGIIPLAQLGYGTAPYGSSPYGCSKFLTSVRKTVSPVSRAGQLSVKLTEKSLDSDGAIYAVVVEAQIISTALIPQVNQR